MTCETPLRGFARSVACASALVVAVLLAGCKNPSVRQAPERRGGEILVSAAVSLKEAFGEIAPLYTAASGVKVVFNFGGSGELEKQIEFGAPADVFVSAGEREMDELVAKGLIDLPSRADFAGNTLVLIGPAEPGAHAASFSELALPRFKRIAIGNPQTVPAGHYAEQALRNNRLWDAVGGRLILAENVRQVLEYVARGEVDAGLVYSTDVAVARDRVKVFAEVPTGSYGPIRYPIAVVKNSPHADAARRFLSFVLSGDGQRVLKEWGFAPVH